MEYTVDSGTESESASYIYGNYIDEALLMADANGDWTHAYIHNHLYSPVAMIDWTNGAIAERCEYSVYGTATVRLPGPDNTYYALPDDDIIQDEPETANPYLYTGRRLDILDSGSLKLQYSRHRYYDAQTGRFLQKDPAGYVDGLNAYEYVRSYPILAADPTGLFVPPIIILPPGFEPPEIPRQEQYTYKMMAVDALRAFDKYHNTTEYYSTTGFSGLIDTLENTLGWVRTVKYTDKDFLYYQRSRRRLGVTWQLEDFMGKRLIYQKRYGEMLIHELVHAYLHQNGKYQGNYLGDDYYNERLAYATQYLAEGLSQFHKVDTLVKEILNGERQWDQNTKKKLRLYWNNSWRNMNRIATESRGYLNREYHDEWEEMSGIDDGGFLIGPAGVNKVKNEFGITISCRAIAGKYNKLVNGKLTCVEFVCRSPLYSDDIGVTGKLENVFR
ncbi:RHS repeat-associated core domain protein [Anaerohalosphaera lusitana]|uniref:RHS repeat-associated core domain protein n=1 Tax=Anaerohalosphaera lusitana TaxID=1936003 RepID=A0A1U9NNA8_9BACT|nr:RHS repeat-associated core domain-containing protein [Anaerohalosphaera lusitana]AQT69287.1 RHS repeat-associated core domain protein [Anaerohalosphaera lusitana]